MYSGTFAISIFETDHENVSDLYNIHDLKRQMTGLGDSPCGEVGCQMQCQMECGFFMLPKKNPQMLNILCRKCISISLSIGAIAGYCKF